MDPFMQALMQILQTGGGGSPQTGGLGPTGEFSTQPQQDISQLSQIGEPLQMGGGQQQMQMPGGMQPSGQMAGMQSQPQIPGMQNPLQPGHSNAINSGQGHSSMMAPPTPQSLMQALQG